MGLVKLNRVESTLKILHKDSQKDFLRMQKGVVKSIFRPMQPSDFEKIYLPISQQQGHDLRNIIINNNCKSIVEFGTSFGISTIYLADAAKQTGGKVISTELLASKVKKAEENIKDAGLEKFAEVRVGDAMETLKNHTEPIDFLFLDGWKDLYLPLFKMLEPNFHEGTIIYADNMDMSGTRAFANYVLGKKDTYITEVVHQGKAFLSRLK